MAATNPSGENRPEGLTLAEELALIARYDPSTGRDTHRVMFSFGNASLAEAAATLIELSDGGHIVLSKQWTSRLHPGASTTGLTASGTVPSHPQLRAALEAIVRQQKPKPTRWFLLRVNTRGSDELLSRGLLQRVGALGRRYRLTPAGMQALGTLRHEIDTYLADDSTTLPESVSDRSCVLAAILRAGDLWKPVDRHEKRDRRLWADERLQQLQERATRAPGVGAARGQLLFEMNMANVSGFD